MSLTVTKTVYGLCEGAINMEKRKELQDKILEAVRCPSYVEYGEEDGEANGEVNGQATVSVSIIQEGDTGDRETGFTYKKSSSSKSRDDNPKTSPVRRVPSLCSKISPV